MAVRRDYIAGLYRDLLQREGSEQEIEGHINNPGGEEGLRKFFMESPEYTAKHGGQATWHNDAAGHVVQGAPPPPPAAPVTDVPPPAAPVAPPAEPYTGFTPRYDYSAFNTGRLQQPAKSAKDAFAMVSNQAPPPPFHSKQALPGWFNQYVRPGFEALGHKVLSVGEDGFTYTNHEGTFHVDFAQNAGAAPGTMQQRLQWLATPADEATRQRYGSGSGSGSSGGSGTLADLKSLFTSLGQQYAGPGGAGQTNGPLEQVGQDPLSQLISGALVDFIGRGGSTAFGQEVQNILREGLNGTNPNAMRRFESARELMAKGRRTMMNDARGALAHRGLLSEPGIPQGAEIGAVKRIEEAIAPEFARALRDIYTEETSKSLELATGMASDQARTFLAGIGEGTARQTALANIALQSLSQNMAWNQFLAEFGLKRDALLAQLQQGRVDDVMQLLNTFVSVTSLARGGYV